jgi:hypothetical protein
MLRNVKMENDARSLDQKTQVGLANMVLQHVPLQPTHPPRANQGRVKSGD